MSQKIESESHNDQQSKMISHHQIFKSYLDMPVWQLRHLEVSKYIEKYGITKVLDIGCAEGTLINRLSRSSQVQLLIGVDMDLKVLEAASGNVQPEMIQDSIGYHRKNPLLVQLYNLNALQSYPIRNLPQIQLITMIQFIEHIHEQDLQHLLAQTFQKMGPKYIMITTPNKQFNVHFNFKPQQMRHPQHIFEWTQQQFRGFCGKVGQQFGYEFQIFGIGEHKNNADFGYCSQGAFFIRNSESNMLNLRQSQEQSKAYIQPFFECKYPYWKDRLKQKIQSQLVSILHRNNYSTPKEVSQSFRASKIGKKLLQQLQSEPPVSPVQLGQKKYKLSEQEEIWINFKKEIRKFDQEDGKQKQLFGEQWVIQTVSKIKYCEFDQENNQICYEYYESQQMQDEQYQLNQENQQTPTLN